MVVEAERGTEGATHLLDVLVEWGRGGACTGWSMPSPRDTRLRAMCEQVREEVLYAGRCHTLPLGVKMKSPHL